MAQWNDRILIFDNGKCNFDNFVLYRLTYSGSTSIDINKQIKYRFSCVVNNTTSRDVNYKIYIKGSNYTNYLDSGIISRNSNKVIETPEPSFGGSIKPTNSKVYIYYRFDGNDSLDDFDEGAPGLDTIILSDNDMKQEMGTRGDKGDIS